MEMARKSLETMSLTAFAEKHGVDRKTATRWRQSGLIVPCVGPVDVVASEARLAERPSQYRGGKTKGLHAPDDAPAYDGPTLADAKRIKSTFEALLAEHRRDKLLNSLMPVRLRVGWSRCGARRGARAAPASCGMDCSPAGERGRHGRGRENGCPDILWRAA